MNPYETIYHRAIQMRGDCRIRVACQRVWSKSPAPKTWRWVMRDEGTTCPKCLKAIAAHRAQADG